MIGVVILLLKKLLCMHGKQYLCTGFQNRLIVIQKGVRVVGRNLNVVFFYLGICYLD